MLGDYVRIAWQNIKGKRLRSWLTLIGILIGIAAVVGLIGLGGGLRNAVVSQFFSSTSPDILSVQASGGGGGPPGLGVVQPLTTSDVDAIARINGVDESITRLVPTLRTEFNDVQDIGFGGSLPPDDVQRELVIEVGGFDLETGRMLKPTDRNKVVIGHNLALDTNSYGKEIVIGNKIEIQDELFEVVGILKKRGSFIVDNIFVINEKPIQDITNYGDRVDLIAVKVKDKDQIDSVAENIEELLRKRRDVRKGEEDFSVETPEASLQNLEDILGGIQIFISIIASVSIIVGALGIINTMFTAVLERTPQIGIMKSIGATNRDIFFLFLIESGLMGLIGGVIGAIVGSLVAYFGTLSLNNFLGATSAPEISIGLIAGALIGSFVVGAAAGVIPALRAASLKPVEALRS